VGFFVRLLLSLIAAVLVVGQALGRTSEFATVATHDIWAQRLDISSSLQQADFWEPTLAVGSDQVVFRSGGRMCAFHVSDGHRRWCSAAGDHPVFVRGHFVYITDDNTIAAVDAETGTRRWTFRFHIDPNATLPGARTFVWTFAGKLAATSYARTDPGHVPYAVVNADGRTLWTGRDQGAVHGRLVALSLEDAIIPQQGSGAILVMPWRLLHVEPKPGFGASFSSATAFLGRHGGLVFADADSFASVDDRLTSFRVRVDDQNGRTLQDRRYSARGITPKDDECMTTCEGSAVAIDQRFVYGRIHDVLYRFPWVPSKSGSSTSLGEATSFVGRTSAAELIVTRRAGTWLIDSSSNTIRSQQLSKENVVLLHRTLDGFDVLGFGGGQVVVIDARKHVVAERTDCPLVDVARSGTRFILACGAPIRRVEAVAIQS
jgi:hypothetical protein